jgi:8-oxo-dGTP pyrophosphatase MutT (NUDIX family)
MKQFGEKREGLEYKPRPSAFDIALGEARRVLICDIPKGRVFPGGGLDPGEPHEAARTLTEEASRWALSLV